MSEGEREREKEREEAWKRDRMITEEASTGRVRCPDNTHRTSTLAELFVKPCSHETRRLSVFGSYIGLSWN